MRLIGYYNPSVILTYIGLAASIVGITFALNGDIRIATMLILVSSVCDMFDGAVARKVKRNEEEKRFGIQIDSLCDLICFGIFPALIGWGLGIRSWIGIVGMVFFVLCGVIRLAYFNVTEDLRQQQTKDKRKNYEGLPITSVALIIPALFCSKPFLAEVFPIAYMILLILVAVCFILKWKIKKLGITGNIVLVCIGILILTILVATGFLH